jgi:dihydroorotate dehydrogenase electron transfer subunit
MKQFDAEILENRQVALSWHELILGWDEDAGRPAPGQFFTLRVSERFDPLLRRPLAFAGLSAGGARVSALYQLRGTATRTLSGLGSGAKVDVIGPLGRAFPPPEAGETAVIAGGGIGLGPVLFLADRLARPNRPDADGDGPDEDGDGPGWERAPASPARDARGAILQNPEILPSPPKGSTILLVGFRDAASIPDIDLPPGTVLCTDDGSAGFRGSPLDWLSRNAPTGAVRVFACGPSAMLAAIAAFAKARGWASSLSAEQWMACGVGACMGCALPRPGGAGYLRACADGPVFEGDEIDWAREASR